MCDNCPQLTHDKTQLTLDMGCIGTLEITFETPKFPSHYYITMGLYHQ